MGLKRWVFVFTILFLGLSSSKLNGQSLRGTKASMQRQFAVAEKLELPRPPNAKEVKRLVDEGLLVRLTGNERYRLVDVSHPYMLPSTKLFVDRLSPQYLACGEILTVTSATRPLDEQPSNASEFSVHPNGMSVDFRIPETAKCRNWLRATLLSLEKRDVIDATREYAPPHYHVAVFPDRYLAYVESRTVKPKPKPAKKVQPAEEPRRAALAKPEARHRKRR